MHLGCEEPPQVAPSCRWPQFLIAIVRTLLVVMNNAYKCGQHDWCAPMSTIQRYIGTNRS
jgi:hypothetical protein